MLLRKYCHILRLHILIPTSGVIKALSLKKDTKTNRQSIVNDFISLAQINFTFLIIVNTKKYLKCVRMRRVVYCLCYAQHLNIYVIFLTGFCFTNTHDSQDGRGRRRPSF